MTFTTSQLSTQINNSATDLATWAGSTLANQAPMLPGFTAYFTNLQNWIAARGGANPFGWNNVTGLTRNNGVQVVLNGPAARAPFNDAFDDVRAHINAAGFRLFQAAEAQQRLVNALILIG